LGIGDWAQSPIPDPQSPIPNPHKEISYKIFYIIIKYYKFINPIYNNINKKEEKNHIIFINYLFFFIKQNTRKSIIMNLANKINNFSDIIIIITNPFFSIIMTFTKSNIFSTFYIFPNESNNSI